MNRIEWVNQKGRLKRQEHPESVETMVANGTLIVVPTEMEKRILAGQHPRFETAQVIGFGILESVISAIQILQDCDSREVLLIGIAGTFDPSTLALGTASEFGSVFCDGIGVGQFDNHLSDYELGWRTADASQPIALAGSGPALLSVAAGSADSSEADWRRKRFATAAAEDMEAYGIARACQVQGARLRVIRGISNVAGDRDPAHWQIAPALRAAAELAFVGSGDSIARPKQGPIDE